MPVHSVLIQVITRSFLLTGTGAKTSSFMSSPRQTNLTLIQVITLASCVIRGKLLPGGGTPPDDEENGLGSLNRIWFMDWSAGPELNTDNWLVDVADVDDNGVDDHRMPPIWEYGGANAGALPMGTLSSDMGLVIRNVAINLLFTTSPLYDPSISGPELPEDIQLDINVYQMDPDTDGRDFFDTTLPCCRAY